MIKYENKIKLYIILKYREVKINEKISCGDSYNDRFGFMHDNIGCGGFGLFDDNAYRLKQ